MAYTFNYSKLKGRIVEKLGSINSFAKEMELSENTIYQKIGGKIEFRQSEILNACKILDILDKDIHIYFFCITN